jgi:uncharacterized GH25 family protein
MKPLLLIAALLIVGVCAWILLPPVDSSSLLDDGQPQADLVVELEGVPDLEAEVGEPEPAADVIQRTEVESADIEPAAMLLNEQNSLLITVVDTAGKPLPGATVYVLDSPPNDQTDKFINDARQKSLEMIFEIFTTAHIADAQAQVRIPKPTSKLILAGSTHRHFGSPITISIVDDKTILVLDYSNAVLVRVVDRGGNPVPGVPVVLYADDRPVENGMIQARTDANGIASLKVSWAVQREIDERDVTSVGVNILSEKIIAEPIDLNDLPTEPLRLVIPPTGQVEVLVQNRVDEQNSNSHFVALYSLTKRTDGVANWTKSRTPLPQRCIDGRTLYTHVGLGLLLRADSASIERTENLSVDQAGPQRPGELVTITIAPKAGSTVLVGRILNTEGAVAKNLTLQTRLRLYQRGVMQTSDRMQVVTNEEGRFEMHLKEPYKQGTERSLTVVMRPTKRKAQRSVFVDLSRDLGAGEYDIGDLVVDFPPVMLGGRVQDEAGRPIKGARVEIQRFTTVPDSNGRTYWDDIRYWRSYTDEDGNFEVHGYPEDGRLRLSATADGYAQAQQEIQTDDMNIHLVMEKSFEVTGRILLDPEIDHKTLFARLHRPNPQFPDDPYNQSVHVTADGHFTFGVQPQGNAKVLIRSQAFREELHVIDNLYLLPDGNADVMTIPDIDLRGMLSSSTITLVDESLKPLSDSWIRLIEVRTGMTTLPHGAITVVRRKGPFTIEVGAPGRRSSVIEGVEGDREIIVGEDSLRVQLQIDNGDIVPTDWKLYAAILYQADGGNIDGTRSQLLDLDIDYHCEIDVPLPGIYAIKFLVTHAMDGRASKMFGLGNGVDFATVEVLDQPEQRLTVSLDPEELSEAMDKTLAWEREQ